MDKIFAFSKYLIVFIWLLVSCKTQDIVSHNPPANAAPSTPENTSLETEEPEEEITETRELDPIEVTAPRGYSLPRYNPSSPRTFDLIHTQLDLRFDWKNEHVLGSAELTLVPYFYPERFLILDAKGFDILNLVSVNEEELEYEYDGQKLSIDLGKYYNRHEKVQIIIDYIAKPSEGPSGGSAAITSDKGLFFINPRNEQLNKPQQIWTQGETENNSRWFPTIDKPNENSTQDLTITTDDRFATLSNGELVSSTKNIDGTRTDRWVMEKPHAPYLFMLAIGEFAIIRDKWEEVDLSYYVEPDYAPYALDIYAHTPEMLSFFSSLLDYPYPWNKFSQVITRDYVSGAMENTTAVIYGEFIQKTDRELIDNNNDFIIAHEMFHHWFGDLVTIESWANLTLQEGMANYSEYLWQEYKNGDDAAGYQRSNELSGYLASIQQGGIHPLIFYGYGDKEDMFDGHSYNKGGLVFHMLRNYIGDEAFFTALHNYLTDNAYSAVEAENMRMAFEEVYGEDLNWFFDQWFYKAGHPILELSYSYDTLNQEEIIHIAQTQDPETNPPIFQLPVAISLFDKEGNEELFDVWITKREQTFRLPMKKFPALVIFDRDDELLYQKKENKTIEAYMNQYRWAPSFRHRSEAINKLKRKSLAQDLLVEALSDAHFSIRKLAVENVRVRENEGLVARIKEMALTDPHSKVRAQALKKLSTVGNYELEPLLDTVLIKELAYPVISAALKALNRINKDKAAIAVLKLKNEKTNQLIDGISSVLADSGKPEHLDYFEDRLLTISLFSVFNFYDQYFKLLSKQDPKLILEKAQKLKAVGVNHGAHIFYRFMATSTLNRLKENLSRKDAEISQSLATMVEEIKSTETNDILIQRYQAF